MPSDASEIMANAADGNRISIAGAVRLFIEADFNALLDAAHSVRMMKHPEKTVTYTVDRNVNYTNICVSGCRFCAFFRGAAHPEAYVLSFDALDAKLAELVESGGISVLLQGGLHPDFGIEWYEELVRHIKDKFDVHVHGFSPPEIVHISRQSRLDVETTIGRLRESGLDTIPGGGAEILSDRVRRELSPNKCTAGEWIDVMRTAHRLGMKTTATMMFGHIETIEERVGHLGRIRDLQDETGGFTAFIPWTFQGAGTFVERMPAGGVEYLRTLAVSRLFLDNVDNIQGSWVTQGDKIAALSLVSGANDLGGTMMEENVVRAAGAGFRMSESEIRRTISGAGFMPAKRDVYYRILEQEAPA